MNKVFLGRLGEIRGGVFLFTGLSEELLRLREVMEIFIVHLQLNESALAA